jgi:lipoprotein-releasing system permease protein
VYKLFMALRYLRSHRIIYFSIAGVAIGIMVMIVVTSVMGGFSRDLRTRIRGMQADLVVIPATPNVFLRDYDQLCEEIRKIPGVQGCSPRIEWKAWLQFRNTYKEVTFLGIVPEQEKGVSQLDSYFKAGGKEHFDFRTEPSPEGVRLEIPGAVVLGREFPIFGISEFQLMTVRYEGGPFHQSFQSVGDFKSGMAEYDHSFLIMNLSDAQSFMKLKGAITTVSVTLDDYEADIHRVRAELVDVIHAFGKERNHRCYEEFHRSGRCGRFQTRTWEEAKAILLQAVSIEKGIQIVVLFFIIIVAGFNIMAIYTLVVRAKTREIGIMRALGASPRGIIIVFLLSGMFCGLVGSLIGIGAGLTFSYNANEVADFIEIGSREFNQLPRGDALRSVLLLVGGLITLIMTWVTFSWKDRLHAFPMGLLSGFLIGIGTWTFLGWLGPHENCTFALYEGHLEGTHPARFWCSFVAGGLPILLVLFREWLRRKPEEAGWSFLGFGTGVSFSGLLLGLVVFLGISLPVVFLSPSPVWPGLELFKGDVYYLDRIPVFVDTTTIALIVIMTLAVSFVFSIYPALRAAKADPIDAIRE